jgi:hypothetical protein
MKERFGEFLADGDLGNRFRFDEVQPALDANDLVVFNFAGVTNMTDSFVNACFANLAAERPDAVLAKMKFENCTEVVRQFVSSAVSLGLRMAEETCAGEKTLAENA